MQSIYSRGKDINEITNIRQVGLMMRAKGCIDYIKVIPGERRLVSDKREAVVIKKREIVADERCHF